MLDESNHLFRPARRIFNRDIQAVCVEELYQRHKSSALVPLLERMGMRNAGHQPDPEHEDVLLAVRKCVLRTSQAAFQQSSVA